MKNIRILVVLLWASQVYGGCLDGVDTAQFIDSPIRGFYVNDENTNTHYVIIDKAKCTIAGSVEPVGKSTQEHYYLSFDNNDKVLQSILLMAYAKGETVKFRFGPVNDGYSSISYVVAPYDARN